MPPVDRIRRLGHAALLALALALAWFAYWGALRGPFLFDDRKIFASLITQDLGRFFHGAFFELFAARPVTVFSFALQYRVWGAEVAPYHVVNVLLHLGVAVLIFIFTRRTLRDAGHPRSAGVAVAVAGLFAVHPLQSEAVSYVSQRAECLASFFYLASLLLLLAAEEQGSGLRGTGLFLAAVVAFGAGLGSKQIAATIPAAYLLQRLAASARAPPRRWVLRALLAAPLFLTSTASAVVNLVATRGSAWAGLDAGGLGPWRYFLTELRMVPAYLRLLVWPAGQNFDHDVDPSRGLVELRTLAAAAAVALVLGFAVWLLRRGSALARVAGFGLVWFLLLLSPTSLVPIRDLMAEHRVYLASWGVLLAVAIGADHVIHSLAGPRALPWAAALTGVAWAGLAGALALRNRVYTSEEALWRDVVATSPLKARGHLNLGYALSQKGDLAGAYAELRAALALDRERMWTADALSNLGAICIEMGRLEEAEEALRWALRLLPGDPEILLNLAILRLQTGDLDRAEELARQVLARRPGAQAYQTLGMISLAREDLRTALTQFVAATVLAPDDPGPRFGRGLVEERLGLESEACASFMRAVQGLDARRRSTAREHAAALGCPLP